MRVTQANTGKALVSFKLGARPPRPRPDDPCRCVDPRGPRPPRPDADPESLKRCSISTNCLDFVCFFAPAFPAS